MLFEIERVEDGYSISSRRFAREPAGELGLREKHIETWLAERPDLLLPNEQVLVIGQSVAGQAMADILALDSFGRLIIVEIKRGRSGRETVAQLLGYAARMQNITYEELNQIAQRYWGPPHQDLYARFQDFAEGQSIPREELGKRQRVLIVAPESDTDLRDIVAWLASYGVPIQIVPFAVYADSEATPRFFEIEGVVTTPELDSEEGSWQGDWIFNTNESYGPGAYARMFERNVAAVYGYANGPANLEGSKPGNRVFAYVNRQGLRALGTVVDGSVHPGEGIFFRDGRQCPDEYYLQVNWDLVLPEDQALSACEARELGYELPVRSVFARLKNGPKARKLEMTMRQRISSQ
jgi:hypothetical protein